MAQAGPRRNQAAQAQEQAEGPRRHRTPKHKLHEPSRPDEPPQAKQAAPSALAHQPSSPSSGWSAEGAQEARSPSPRLSISARPAGAREELSPSPGLDRLDPQGSAEQGWISVTPAPRHRHAAAQQHSAGAPEGPGLGSAGKARKQQGAASSPKPVAAAAPASPGSRADRALQAEASSVGPKQALGCGMRPQGEAAKGGQGQPQSLPSPQAQLSPAAGSQQSPQGPQGSRRQARRQARASQDSQVLPQVRPRPDVASGAGFKFAGVQLVSWSWVEITFRQSWAAQRPPAWCCHAHVGNNGRGSTRAAS